MEVIFDMVRGGVVVFEVWALTVKIVEIVNVGVGIDVDIDIDMRRETDPEL